MRPNPKGALHQERPSKSDTLQVPTQVPPPPPSWVSGSAALFGVFATFGVVSLLSDENPLRAALLRSPLSQMCTVGLFWWGATLLWLRRRQALAEHESLSQLAALLTPVALTSLVQGKLTGAAQRYDALSYGLSAPEAGLAHLIGGSTLRSLYLEAQTGSIKYERIVHNIDRSYQQGYDRLESEYRGVTAVMWLMPLSGFLGTVIGMSAAIASFDTVIASAGVDLKSLAPAVTGLSTAFDTTLVALALVVPLKLAEVLSERRDHRLLDEVDHLVGVGLIDRVELSEIDTPEPSLGRTAEQLSLVKSGALEAERALVALSERLTLLSEQLPVPVEGLSRQLDERSHNSDQLMASIERTAHDLSERLTQLLIRQDEMRRLSDARINESLETLIEQNDRPLVLSRRARS